MNEPTRLAHLKAIFILPFNVVITVPFIILFLTQHRFLEFDTPSKNLFFILGGVLMSIGLALFITTIRLFSVLGKGTLAPWQPPKKLIIVGLYRYVRNPMVSSIFLMLLGEAMFFYSKAIFIWFLIFMVLNCFFLIFWEEPRLAKRFGEEYKHYQRTVPRWIPLLRRYTPQ